MTSNDYRNEIRAVKKDLNALKDDVETLSEKMIGDAHTRVDVISEKAKAKLQSAKVRAAESGGRSKEKISDAIVSRPLASIAATAGAGLIAGALLRR